jgi:acetyl-CoA acyltransferase
MTTMCIGLGMGATVIWENPHHADYGTEFTTTTGAAA